MFGWMSSKGWRTSGCRSVVKTKLPPKAWLKPCETSLRAGVHHPGPLEQQDGGTAHFRLFCAAAGRQRRFGTGPGAQDSRPFWSILPGDLASQARKGPSSRR